LYTLSIIFNNKHSNILILCNTEVTLHLKKTNKGERILWARFANQHVENTILEEDVELLKLMAHPMRLKLINELSKHKTLNVTQMTEILNIPQSTVSQHLSKMRGKVLRGNRQGLEIYYSIENQKAEEIMGLLGPIQ
jgi:DNA-binding transcriptional ArsR family regulator